MKPKPMLMATKEFETQAKRAARSVSWILHAGFCLFISAFFGGISVLLWMNAGERLIPAIVGTISILILAYGIWRAAIGRFRDLICPQCHIAGIVEKHGDRYIYSCAKCGQAADTGIVDGAGD
jgi:hypothetical protein